MISQPTREKLDFREKLDGRSKPLGNSVQGFYEEFAWANATNVLYASSGYLMALLPHKGERKKYKQMVDVFTIPVLTED